ncbi:MAG: glycosyltransferase family 2 protein [Gammaproteobacteria bacterium]|nr:glycosyltransferase family 2 protein [Gammaproteobacteria bacterium]
MNYLETEWQVPKFETHEIQERLSDYCVCVFIINEGEKFLAQLKRMAAPCKGIDIVIADGGSTDGSTEINVMRELGVNTLLVKTGEGKLGSQMRMAFAWALRRGYTGVVVIDGNNKDSVEDIPRFVDMLGQGFDHVQGSRFIPGGHHENTPVSRLLGLKLLHAPLMRYAAGFAYTDTTNGYRAYSESLLRDPRIAIFRDVFTGYELHYYLAIKAARLGYKCIEIPVTRKYPKTGKTPTKISPVRGNLTVIAKLLDAVRGKYDPE